MKKMKPSKDAKRKTNGQVTIERWEDQTLLRGEHTRPLDPSNEAEDGEYIELLIALPRAARILRLKAVRCFERADPSSIGGTTLEDNYVAMKKARHLDSYADLLMREYQRMVWRGWMANHNPDGTRKDAPARARS